MRVIFRAVQAGAQVGGAPRRSQTLPALDLAVDLCHEAVSGPVHAMKFGAIRRVFRIGTGMDLEERHAQH